MTLPKVPHKVPCSVSGCEGLLYLRGLCRPHYRRLMSHGDPLAGRASYGDPLAFIDDAIAASAGSGCIIWPFAVSLRGYGQLKINGKSRRAHRIVCERVHGPQPSPHHEVAHKCGNASCIAPGCLRWATHAENEADKILHGTDNRTRKLMESANGR